MLEQTSRTVNRWVETWVVVFGLTMAVTVAVQVFSRHVLNHSLFWSEELARYLLVWISFFGASIAYRRNAHPGIDIFYLKMPPSMQKTARIVVHLAALALFGVMVVYGIRFAWFVRMQITPALNLPRWAVMSAVPISGVILIIHNLAAMAREWRGSS